MCKKRRFEKWRCQCRLVDQAFLNSGRPIPTADPVVPRGAPPAATGGLAFPTTAPRILIRGSHVLAAAHPVLIAGLAIPIADPVVLNGGLLFSMSVLAVVNGALAIPIAVPPIVTSGLVFNFESYLRAG